MKIKLLLTLFLLTISAFPFVLKADACTIPVFRYAIERWSPDLFEVIVFYEEEEPTELLEPLRKHDMLNDGHGNYVINAINKSGPMDDIIQPIWNDVSSNPLPWVVIRNLNSMTTSAYVWEGSLHDPFVQHIPVSPIRQEVAERLIDGQSLVWVFLESGNQQKDDEAFKTLTDQLKHLQQTLKLPEQDPSIDMEQVNLRIEFSTLRVSRDDPNEPLLITQLLQSEADLSLYRNEPIAFPIYGRGRVLFALIGKGINADTLHHACSFITGECSCQVKDLNPGTDLLVTANWESAVQHSLVGDWEMSIVSGENETVKKALQIADESIEGASAAVTSNYGLGSSNITWNIVIAIGFILILNVILVFSLKGKLSNR